MSLQKQAYVDVLQNRFFRNFPIFAGKHLCRSLFLIKLQAYLNKCVFLWMLQHFLIVNLQWYLWSSLLNQKQCRMVSNKKVRSCHKTRYLNTLLVETISTRFYWLTCRNQKLAQNKPLQQRLFDLILGFWQYFFIF